MSLSQFFVICVGFLVGNIIGKIISDWWHDKEDD